MNTKRLLTGLLLLVSFGLSKAQGEKSDTVIVNLANTSQIIFTMKDRSDLDMLKHYDFQHLFEDIIAKIESSDTTTRNAADIIEEKDTIEGPEEAVWSLKENKDGEDDDDEEDWDWGSDEDDDEDEDWDNWDHRKWGRTWQSFNFDLGTNNYLEEGSFPDANGALYAVRPWGSWYVAVNSTQRTRIGRNFFLEWGVGLSWYNFKFQKDNIILVKDDQGVTFVEDDRDASFKKSKLTASYLNISIVPVFDFSDEGRRPRFWDGNHDAFRIGIGPYLGYRVGSHSKLVYKENGGREKDKDRDNFYLENLRYGLRLQLGFRSTDLFFNYDLNELFANQKGPSLNAFSFGVIF